MPCSPGHQCQTKDPSPLAPRKLKAKGVALGVLAPGGVWTPHAGAGNKFVQWHHSMLEVTNSGSGTRSSPKLSHAAPPSLSLLWQRS